MSQIIEPSLETGLLDRVREAFRAGDPDVDTKQTEAENVQRVQEQYQAVARGDFAAFADQLDPDVEMEIVGPSGVPMTGRARGRDQAVEAARQNFALLEGQRPEILSVIAQGDTVVVFGREQGRLRATGRDYDLHWVHEFTFRDGKVVRFRELFDTAAIAEAARPSPP